MPSRRQFLATLAAVPVAALLPREEFVLGIRRAEELIFHIHYPDGQHWISSGYVTNEVIPPFEEDR